MARRRSRDGHPRNGACSRDKAGDGFIPCWATIHMACHVNRWVPPTRDRQTIRGNVMGASTIRDLNRRKAQTPFGIRHMCPAINREIPINRRIRTCIHIGCNLNPCSRQIIRRAKGVVVIAKDHQTFPCRNTVAMQIAAHRTRLHDPRAVVI